MEQRAEHRKATRTGRMFRWRWHCVVLGYASFGISLCLPAIPPGIGTDGYGYECLYWSIVLPLHGMADLVQSARWPGISPGEAWVFVAGWANSWLLFGWVCLFIKSRAVRIASTAWGYAGLTFTIASGGTSAVWGDPLYAGYFLWCAAFALVATGMLLSGRAPYN